MKKHFINITLASVIVMGASQFSVALAENTDHNFTQAQPELTKQPLTIITKNGQKHGFSVEIAKTPKEQEIGEMFRTSIPDNGGMLFVWPTLQESNMWMKNTVVPLDMVFIDAKHHIQAIAENTVPYSLAPISSHGAVVATLELQGGIAEKLGITVGDVVESPAFTPKVDQQTTASKVKSQKAIK